MFLMMLQGWKQSLEDHSVAQKDIKIYQDFILIMDNMQNEMRKTFNSMPDRWSILYQNKVVYKGEELPMKGKKGNKHKELQKIDKWLAKHV